MDLLAVVVEVPPVFPVPFGQVMDDARTLDEGECPDHDRDPGARGERRPPGTGGGRVGEEMPKEHGRNLT
jgi:hypothetical protein